MQHIPTIIMWLVIAFCVYKCEQRKDIKIKQNHEIEMKHKAKPVAMPVNINGVF